MKVEVGFFSDKSFSQDDQIRKIILLQVGANAWNPEAGILGLHIRRDNLKKSNKY